MTRGRPARPDEIPRYGSIWEWSDTTTEYLALGVRNSALDTLVLNALIVFDGSPARRIGEIDHWMFWSANGVTLTNWTCIDEGPE